jgi:hypothetical protein
VFFAPVPDVGLQIAVPSASVRAGTVGSGPSPVIRARRGVGGSAGELSLSQSLIEALQSPGSSSGPLGVHHGY